MKKIIAVIAAAAMTLAMTACGPAASSSSDTVSDTVDYSYGLTEEGYYEGVDFSEYVTLSDSYKNLSISQENVSETEEDWENYYTYVASMAGTKSEVPDATAADKSFVTIDFKGTIDGKEFTGGSATDVDLQIGSGAYLEEFETGIIGHKAGDTFDIEVPFPEGYGSTTDVDGNEIDLSGKTATFSITLKSVNEYVLTDENIESYYSTVNENREDKILNLDGMRTYAKEMIEDTKLQNEVLARLQEECSVSEIPEAVIDAYVHVEMELVEQNASSAGLTSESLVQMNGFESVEDYKNYITENPASYLENQLILLAIAENEGLQYDEDTCRNTFSGEPSELIELYGQGYVYQNVLCQKALDFVLENIAIS